MTPAQIGASVAAVLLMAWPWAKKLVPSVSLPAAGGVSYEDAIHNLAVVRSRLRDTGLLADEQKKAIDALTLALVAGSDK